MGERERNVLFKDALNTFYLRLYGIRHMVMDHSDSDKGNPLPPHWLLFSISIHRIFYMNHPTDRIAYTTTFVTPLLHTWRDGSLDRSFMVDPLSYFSFQPGLHDWCNKGRGMCYPVCGMVHIKEPLLLIDKSSLCGDSGFPFSLSEWSLTICLTPYNRK